MEITNNESIISGAIPKRPLVMRDGIFVLARMTRAGSPNDNGVAYTKEAFDNAMNNYIKKHGGKLYLAPACVKGNYDIDTIRKINSEVYSKFHHPNPKSEYAIGEVIDWTDYTITFRYTPTNVSSNLINTVLEESHVCIRYTASVIPNILISKMDICCLDVPSIPFEVLNIDIDDIINR